jgi:hypothetical protein
MKHPAWVDDDLLSVRHGKFWCYHQLVSELTMERRDEHNEMLIGILMARMDEMRAEYLKTTP